MSTTETTAVDTALATIAEILEVPRASLTPDTPLSDVVPDSFVLVELAIALEERVGVTFQSEDLGRVRVIGDVLGVIASHGGRARG